MNNIKAIDLTPETESYRIKNKKYLAEIKEIQEYYHPKKYRKHDICKEWKETWKGFVECTYPWDGSNVFCILVYRLEVLRANLKYFCHAIDEEKNKMISELDEAIELGRKIMDFDYDDPAYAFSKEHCAHLAYVYKKLDTSKATTLKDKLNNQGELLATIKMPQDDEFNFKQMIEKNYVSPLTKYLKDNNLKEYKDVTVAYGGEWDDLANHDIWLQMIKDANKQRKADKKKFYNILCNKLESWWD